MAGKQKEYSYEIQLNWMGEFFTCDGLLATSKEDLIKQVKENFYEEYGIELADADIANIKSYKRR
tara:strand:+ start:14595 stop:14789 length:195 start_codon:yes stop_codon:yes gene_type:complete